jgi:hypothetical protein
MVKYMKKIYSTECALRRREFILYAPLKVRDRKKTAF